MPKVVNRACIEYNNLCIIVEESQMGKGTRMDYFTAVDGSGRLETGEYCSTASEVHICTHDTVRGQRRV